MAYYHPRYSAHKKKNGKKKKIIFTILLILFLALAGAAYILYSIVLKPNVWTPNDESVAITIPTGSDFEDVKLILYAKGLVVNRKYFEWWAEKKKYPQLVKPGKYLIQSGMNNNELINLLRSGEQVPVQLIFNNVRDIYQVAQKVSQQIEADSAAIVDLITDSTYLTLLGLNNETASVLFIPNTYEMYWNTSAEGFIKRMHEEYIKFWSGSRTSKARSIDLTIPEVVTLASIVEKETNKDDEKPQVAGVYINRLKAGWRLQADPTVIYALNDYSIKRVLNKHKEIKSPYNTYLVAGLPPGPICIPSIASIDAVLNYDHHNYLFFCAKDDLSGYHVFAKTNRQHAKNAKKYQEALNKMGVYK
ncbi:MAG: endolytic transglycosylase MltG [Bacteroidetes bacterium]|nr:MAG: endolytic transglycosylase MltG [Bacteroidota bacterium]RLD73399.1 MAG: endolytic transglycosylase MltG [Bacteroidota bacterium]RLD87802.1 MAG: endolytic transglycosylase MltG [Bacteroidota bacterium]